MLSAALTLGAVALAGFGVAFFGAWKDTLWEQFSIRKFLRTPCITVLAGVILMLRFGSPAGFWDGVLYVLSSVTLERLAIDGIFKSVRRRMPSKFLRPVETQNGFENDLETRG